MARFENVELRSGTLERLPVADGELDAALLVLVLHYVPDPLRVLREARRVLAPGGRLLIVDMLLRVLVVKPVIGISEMASDVSMGKLDAPEFTSNSQDEIGSLAASFNRMRRSLQNAMKMLEDQP